jgi:C-methyltransferase C-terminal domain/Putative zinc binding domain/Methyltransferase domain
MYKKIEKCRICGNSNLELVLDLGVQMLTGIFPKIKGENITAGPLRLVKCTGGGDVCGLLQLEHSYDLAEMYGKDYGYRSGLNASMVGHLHGKVKRILERVTLADGDLVVDIGSNDSTTLQAYPSKGPTLVGIDPTGVKFGSYYPPHIQLIPDFFSTALLQARFPGKKARIVTSFSMFYDLEDPMAFMREIHQVLADDGVWVFEQSYMPAMLEMNSYDTVCHEHLEFYALRQIKWMTERIGFDILDVELNDVNGGSFSVTVSKSKGPAIPPLSVRNILDDEIKKGLNTLAPYVAFAKCAEESRTALLEFIGTARAQGKIVAALGASTKGNVLLQYCGVTENMICCVGEVNADKLGSFTPGTWIPIISEEVLLASNPDYLVVLPWHFRKFFESVDRLKYVTLVFPLPILYISTPSKLREPAR